MVKVIRVVGAVIEHQGKILACRRHPDKAEGGKWEFPGGKVESGETPQQALSREISEELDIHDAKVRELVTRATTQSGDKRIDLACYRVDVTTLPSSSTDHDSMKWCTQDQLSTLNWARADLPTVEKLTAGAATHEIHTDRSKDAQR
jgi:8-oxo-dGTP diphosphatase